MNNGNSIQDLLGLPTEVLEAMTDDELKARWGHLIPPSRQKEISTDNVDVNKLLQQAIAIYGKPD